MTLKVVLPRARRAAQIILLFIGLVCFGIVAYSYLYRTAYQLYEGWQFDHESSEPEAPDSAYPEHARERKPSVLPVILPDPDRGTPSNAASGSRVIIGRMSIPRLHLAAIVEEGVDDLTLSRAVGHIPGTALPGETGNIGVAGHRDTFFRALKDLRPEDRIDFATRVGHFHYTVESLRVVDPSDVSVLEPGEGRTLTIVTCFPFHYIGNAPRRFIVRAVSR